MKSWKSPEDFAPQTNQGVENSRDTNDPDATEKTSPADTPQSATEFYRAIYVPNRRIHILGIGNMATFMAHALRGIPNPPPVTFIYPNWEKWKQWEDSNRTISLITDGAIEVRDGYDAEVARSRRRHHGKEVGLEDGEGDPTSEPAFGETEPYNETGESWEPIHSLIVCSTTQFVLQELSAVKHRLRKDSIILFLQNGMGTVEEVNKELFPDPETRPYYMVGVNSHLLLKAKEHPFTTIHAGFGTIALGLLPHEREREPAPYDPPTRFSASGRVAPADQHTARTSDLETPPTTVNTTWTSTQRYLLRTLLRSPVLSAAALSPSDLLQVQLERLAVNCVINPLSVMLDARNGALLYNYSLTRVMRLLLSEISLVIRSLPELQYIPNVQQRFDPGRLETVVVGVAQKTTHVMSTMLMHARDGRQTEIDYLNGWIVKKGEEQGIMCMMNYMLMQMVKGKGHMIQMELEEGVPLVRRGDVKINLDGLTDLEEDLDKA